MSSSDSSDSKNNDDDDDRTGAKYNTCYDNGDNGGDRITGARGGSAEWILFLNMSALSETFSDMENTKAYSLTKSRKTEVGKK